MKDPFAASSGLHLREHGDARERHVWPGVSVALSQYEQFWRTLIVLLTNRIDPKVPRGPAWIRIRSTIPSEYEQLAMHNYSLLYYAAEARQGIREDRRRVAAGKYPRPERVFIMLQICVERAVDLQRIAREILCALAIRHKLPRHPKSLYEAIGAYRNAFAHDPILGRAIAHGREMLPPRERLPKKGRPLLWRVTADMPANCMVDGIAHQEQLWQELANFLQEQWASLAKAFLEARQQPKFVTDLGLAAFLPIRVPNAASPSTPRAASGTIIARSDSN